MRLSVGLLAEVLVLSEQALATCVAHGERLAEPELQRCKGELLLLADAGREAEAETCYRQAIDVARELEMNP